MGFWDFLTGAKKRKRKYKGGYGVRRVQSSRYDGQYARHKQEFYERMINKEFRKKAKGWYSSSPTVRMIYGG